MKDRVRETSTTVGTDPFVFGGAPVGFLAFQNAEDPYATGDEVPYVAEAVDAFGALTGEWEHGVGTMLVDGRLDRTAVTRSSTGVGVAVAFSAGTKRVYDGSTVEATRRIAELEASDAIDDHVADTDPHDDRAYADDLVADVVAGLGSAALLDVGTTAGTVAAGDDARFTDARAPSGPAGGDLAGTYPNPTIRRAGLKVHAADTFAISFTDPVQQVRDATGAVTITGLTGLAAGANIELTLRNTTANDIPVTVVPGVQWASKVPSVLVAFGEATIDLTSIGVTDVDVVSRWTAPLTLVERANASGADCGNGCDGDLNVTTTVYVPRDAQYRKVTISGAGKLIADINANVAGGSVLRIQVLDVTAAAASSVTGKTHDVAGGAGATAGTGAGQPNIGMFTAGSVGGAIRQPGGANGGAAGAGAAGTAVNGTSVGGYTRLPAGAGGAGSVGAGGAGGGAGTGGQGIEPLVPSIPAIMWANNTAGGGGVNIANGGMPGAGGGGGGGDGVSGGGGGSGGPGNKPLDVRVGVLLVGPSTGLPIFNGRGGPGGPGGSAVAGNRGGGGAGSGACGTRFYGDIGEIVEVGGAVLPLVGAIDVSGGSGGKGGDGFGTGVGGAGGGGGGGGKIVIRRPSGITVVDDTAVAGVAGSAAVGNVGGNGGAGRQTTGNLS